MVKYLPTMQETSVRSLGWEDPLEKRIATHSSILAWRIHGQRSLVGYSPWGCKQSDTTERLTRRKTENIIMSKRQNIQINSTVNYIQYPGINYHGKECMYMYN